MANLLTDDWRKRASEIYAENAGEDAYLNSVMAEYGIAPKTAAAVDNGILSGFAQGYKSGFGGVGAGLAHAAEAELGVGGGLAKSLDTMAQENAPGKEYDWEEMIPFASDYYTNGQGAARGLGSLVGSMTVPAAVGAGIMTALPTAAAGTLGSGAVAMGLGALPMAVSEGGNTYAKGKELGMSEEKQGQQADKTL